MKVIFYVICQELAGFAYFTGICLRSISEPSRKNSSVEALKKFEAYFTLCDVLLLFAEILAPQEKKNCAISVGKASK